MTDAVFLLSGGLDSQVLLARHRLDYGYAHCVGFRYGQRHARELWSGFQISRYYGATWEVVELPTLRGSALTGDGEIPVGLDYRDPGQAATVVPGRNAVFLAVAAGIAQSRGAADVLYGAHAGDAAVYPDCRPEFVAAMGDALRVGYGVNLRAPFLGLAKRDIVAEGRRRLVPFDLSWSCYTGGAAPCGKCGACVERAEALDADDGPRGVGG